MKTRVEAALAGVTAALLIAACAGLTYAPVKFTNGLMTGANGMTLYTFDKDPVGAGKSVCNGQCAANWPPFMAASGEHSGGDWSIVTREDGSKQWAWLGQPLYFRSKDQKPGDTAGDGFNKVWHAVRPEPRPLTGNMNAP